MIEFANIGATGLYLEIIQQLYDPYYRVTDLI